MIRISHIAILLLTTSFLSVKMEVHAQTAYPANAFISPVDIPIFLSGSFAELRSNHFHSGIDIKTQGKEGKNILACADGYVSRIRISPFGFGKAIYVVHPNGFSTVYAHLRNFAPEIEKWAKSEQYRLQKFDVDLYPAAGLLKVKQGQLIAYSGNSGSSQGPHLHFEVRDSRNEEPIDPLLFGFAVKDFTRPVINGLRIYPADAESSVNGSTKPFDPELAGWGPSYRLKATDTIEAAGNIYLGLNVHDLMNNSSNKNGVNLFQVFIDSVLQFHWQANRFNFNETRYINSFIDYSTYYKTGERYMLTRRLPQNKLSFYQLLVNDGIISTEPGKTQQILIKVADGKNNESLLSFYLKGLKKDNTKKPESVGAQIFSYQNVNQFRTAHINIAMPGKCLYEDIPFEYSAEASQPWSCSMIHKIHDPQVPLHDFFDVSIRIDSSCRVPVSQLVMVRLNKNNKPVYTGSEPDGRYLKARIREFGRYSLMADSLSPVIKALNITDGKNIRNQETIRMSISDNLSGIKTYNAYLNGKWILMDYDAKNNLLEYQFDDLLSAGKNEFKLEISDNAGNKSSYKAMLSY